MKVYVKKGEYQSPIIGIIIMTIFLAFSLLIFFSVLQFSNIIEGISNVGFVFGFAIVFFCFGIYFLYGLFKMPKRFSAKLISKTYMTYNYKGITYMTFRVFNKNKKIQPESNIEENLNYKDYNCFTYSGNNLIVNEIYDVYIKEFTWKIKRVKIERKY